MFLTLEPFDEIFFPYLQADLIVLSVYCQKTMQVIVSHIAIFFIFKIFLGLPIASQFTKLRKIRPTTNLPTLFYHFSAPISLPQAFFTRHLFAI